MSSSYCEKDWFWLIFSCLFFLLRVADYGFTKLIELFEAIPNTVEITEDTFGERLIQLTEHEMLIVAGDQIAAVIKSTTALGQHAKGRRWVLLPLDGFQIPN